MNLDISKGFLRATPQRLMVAVILAVSFAVYFNALFDSFVYDDMPQIVQNPWIRDVRHIPDIFSKSVWSFRKTDTVSNYYRPLMHVVNMFTYLLFGLKPWGFHLVNILFHSANAVLVFFIASKLINETSCPNPELQTPGTSRLATGFLSPPFIAALLFAVHPIHTEAVTWASGLPDVSCTFFALLSFYLYARSGNVFNKDRIISVVLFAFAVLCKETALTLPIILIAYDHTTRKAGTGFTVQFTRYAGYLIVAAIYMALRLHALGEFAPIKRHAYLSTYQYIINVFPLFSGYLLKLLLPINLNLFHVFHPISSIGELQGLASLTVTAVFILISLIYRGKNRMVFFSNLLIVVPLLPTLYIPGLGENTFAERYLYLPSVGFVMLASLAVSRTRSLSRGTVAAASLLAAIAALYAGGTVERNAAWKNNEVLFSDTVKKSPDAVQIRNQLGNALAGEGRLDEAIQQYLISIRLRPDYAESYSNLGAAYGEKGWFDKAVEQLQTAAIINPDSAGTRLNLGTAYALTGSPVKAIEQFEAVIQIDPDSIEAHHGLAMAYAKEGDMNGAIEEYKTLLKLDPDQGAGHYNLGNAYLKAGRRDEAGAEFSAAVRLRPDNALYHNILGITYGQMGLYDRAIEEFKTAVRLTPREQSYRKNLDKAYGLKTSRRATAGDRNVRKEK